ncbi:hypothetical protein Tco_0762086 [Tanacetum coccineum]
MIPLYGERDCTIMKFIVVLVECSPSPNDTISDICPNGHDISPLKPRSGVVAGVICLLTTGQSLLKQCSYKTSEADPPSTYIRWMRWPPTSTSITIEFSCLTLLASGGNEICWFLEKL